MGRHFIIVDDKHKEDGYRREEMYRRMNGGYRVDDAARIGNYRDNEYDEGYRTGYEDAWQDHKSYMEGEGFRRMRDSRGRYM